MQQNLTKQTKAISIIGPRASGKTTLSEAILFHTKAIDKPGSVESGNTVCDFEPDEIEKKFSINSSVFYTKFEEFNLYFIDTPGFPDFLSKVKLALKATDNAILVSDCSSPFKTQMLKQWQFINEFDLPRIIYISQLDKEKADFEGNIKEIKLNLSKDCLPLTIPYYKNKIFEGVIDLFNEKFYSHKSSTPENLPEDIKEKVIERKRELIETIIENNDSLMEKYIEGQELTNEEILLELKKCVQNKAVFPIICGSSILNTGINLLLKYCVTLFSSPIERGEIEGIDEEGNPKKIIPEKNANFSGYVFNTRIDQYAGKLSYIRIFSGTLKSESTIYNATKRRKEKIGQLYLIFGKKQQIINEAHPGEIVVISKSAEISTNDTLSDINDIIIFKPIDLPQPVVSLAISPAEKSDEDKLSSALSKISDEDISLKLERNIQTKQLTISGIGQIQLDTVIDRLRKRFSVEVKTEIPQVPYRETIRKKVQVQGKYKRQSGGRGQYGDVWIETEPLPRGEGFKFVDMIKGGAIPNNYIPAVEKGIVEAMEGGVLAGYPVTDIKVTLYDGTYHPVDSSDMAFKIAGSMALKKAVSEADAYLIEPIMSVEVEIPEEFTGDIIGDLNSRRGKVIGIESKGGMQLIKALVPQAEMLKYANELKSLTGGQGSYTMEFNHFDEVPQKISQQIISKYQENKEKENK